MKTKLVKELSVEVKYRVGLGGLKMPKKVYDQLLKAYNNHETLGESNYDEAEEWLRDNIQERDCCDWELEIEELD